MARFLLIRVSILTPYAGTTFNSGDDVAVYYNDSGGGSIEVDVNSSTIVVDPGTIGEESVNYYITGGSPPILEGTPVIVAGYSFCNGPDLNWFQMDVDFPGFPYMLQMISEDHASCSVGSSSGVDLPVCDIHFIGAPEVTPSTSLIDGDGEFIVEAESSNGTVKYALFDFIYSSEGQASGTFSNLIPGVYTVWAKDANDCTTKRVVTILYEPAEAEYRRMTWSDIHGLRTSRLRIYQKGYRGAVVELPFGDMAPFILAKPIPEGAGPNEKFFPIHTRKGDINIMSETKFEFLIMYTLDNQRFKCVYEVDEGSGFEVKMSGYILPQIFKGEIIHPPYYSKFTMTDNLEALKHIDFRDPSGGLLRGDVKLIKVLAFCLGRTGLQLTIRQGINIWEINHIQHPALDPLDQTSVDINCYRDADGPFSCYKVIECILRPFGARIYQEDGRWIIEEIDKCTESYAWREFDANGIYVTNGTFDPIIPFSSDSENGVEFLDGEQSQEVVAAYGKIKVKSLFNYIGSLLSGGFEVEDLLSPNTNEDFNGWQLRLNGTTGSSFIQLFTSEITKRGIFPTQSPRSPGGGAGDPVPIRRITTDARSIGYFIFDPEAWSGNLRDVYIESSSRPFQYGPGDELRFSFEFLCPGAVNYTFGIIRFSIKVGDDYLQPDLTWDFQENTMRVYPTISADFQGYQTSIKLPDVTGVVDTTIQVRIYFYAAEFFDFGIPEGGSALADIKAFPTVDINYTYKSDFPVVGFLTGRVTRLFVELIPETADEDGDHFNPDDYHVSTNPKHWHIVGRNIEPDSVSQNAGALSHGYGIDNVLLDFLPGGAAPPTEEELETEISKYINEFLEVTLYNLDCPDIHNAKNIYNNYFKIASTGEPTALWNRYGTSGEEPLPLVQILMNILTEHHGAPTFRMRGPFINKFQRIGVNNYLKLTKIGSTLVITNPTFDSDLSDWEGDGDGEAFAWTADNSGSAEVTLSGAESSEKFFQNITHQGGYIEITVSIEVLDTSTANDRQDDLVLLMYRNGQIIHTERIKTFTNADGTYSFTYIAFSPSTIDAIGFFFDRVNGTGDVTYQVTEFNPEGIDIDEIYEITDYSFNERMNDYELELSQISKSYISLAEIDEGGTGQ